MPASPMKTLTATSTLHHLELMWKIDFHVGKCHCHREHLNNDAAAGCETHPSGMDGIKAAGKYYHHIHDGSKKKNHLL